MIKPGAVRAVRELSTGVQAQVCLGADVKHGYAIITVVAKSPEVQEAMADLKAALQKEAHDYVKHVLDGQRAWDQEMGRTG